MFRLGLIAIIGTILSSDLTGQEAPSREEMAKLLELTKPGKEHAQLKELTGAWKISMNARGETNRFAGTATAKMILGDRFLVIDGQGKTGGRESAFRYTIGFDRRHDEYTIIAWDTTGTYHVSAQGKSIDGAIRMFGTDDDPYMKKLGYEKKFAFDFTRKGTDEFAIATLFVDTRTEEEKLLNAMEYIFVRSDAVK